MKLTYNAKRNIGLIALIVFVIVAVIAVVLLVQKYGGKEENSKGAIGQTLSSSAAELRVQDVKLLSEVEDKVAAEGKYFMLAKVKVTAKKKLTLEDSAFSLSGGTAVKTQSGEHWFAEQVALKKGESKEFYLLYEVEAERAASFYLTAFGCSVDMGGSVKSILK